MQQNNIHKSGYVAIVGKPNAGKSTLLNELIGKKISIVTPKPQTTRWQILGIKTSAEAQIIYVDTPGMQWQETRAMNRYMNRVAVSILQDADVIVFVVDVAHYRKEDDMVLDKLKAISKPVILALNKIDLLNEKSLLLPMIEKMQEKFSFATIVPLSALKNENMNALESEIIKLLPEGDALFPDDQLTDKNNRFLVGEIIREKLIQSTEEELPYTTSVVIEQFIDSEKLIDISAVIWVERPGQKAIVIGKNGKLLKLIGTKARKDIEKLLGQKVFLRLWVKVKENWTDDEKALRGLGYE